VIVRPLVEGDLDAADHIMRIAFGTLRGLPEPAEAFGDIEFVRTRFRAAPDCAWVAEVDGAIAGSVFLTRWGSFAFFGPLTTHPDHWDRGVGSRLMEQVVETFDSWELRQSALFTFPNSTKHLGLYQKFGFWPRFLTAIMAKPAAVGSGDCALLSHVPAGERPGALAAIAELTDAVFSGLDVRREIEAVAAQELGDTVLLYREGHLVGVAVCHCGAGSEAGGGACYVKFAATRPGASAAEWFEQLLDACESLAAETGLGRVVAGVNTGRLDAYRRMLARGFRSDFTGVALHSRPEGPNFDSPGDYVIDDLR
jgi:GNAT superfamily N-acetyltransferase